MNSQIPNFKFPHHNIQCNCKIKLLDCNCNCNKVFFSFMYFIIIIYLSVIKLSLNLATQHGDDQRSLKLHYARTSNLAQVSILVIVVQLLSIIIFRLRSKHKHLTLLAVYNHLKYSVDGKSSIFYRSFRKYLVWLAIANLILLTNCNSSMKNPGPAKNLSVLYQNVQGLIPVSELGEEHPTLNENKLFELQALYTTTPLT